MTDTRGTTIIGARGGTNWSEVHHVRRKIFISGKHKIVSSRSIERLDFGSGTKEAEMPKTKLLLHGTLKIGPNLPLKTMKAK
jgi:hypothetical protein